MREQDRKPPWFPPRGVMGWISFAALIFLILVALTDMGIWYARVEGRFWSKVNFISHFWPYFSLSGLVVGLLQDQWFPIF